MNRQIHVCERKKDSNNVVTKISLASTAETLCYSKHALCYATKTEYFVHDLLSGGTHALFPYESEVVRPLAIRVDKDEFILSGMQGLAVFATPDGCPPRPPLFCGSKKIMSFVFHQPFVHILSDDSLIVFSANDQKMKQMIECDKSEFMCNIDGRIFFCGRRGKFCELTPIQWMEQAEELLANGAVEESLQLAENHLQLSDYNTNDLMKFNFLKQRAAFVKLFAGERTEAQKLLLESEVNPREVINLYKEIRYGEMEKSSLHERTEDLPFSETEEIRYGEMEKSSLHERTEDLPFSETEVLEYLLEARSRDWASYALTTIDKALVKLFTLAGKHDAIKELDSKWNDEETRSWLLNQGSFALVADLTLAAGDSTRSFDLWRRLGTGELRDKRFDHAVPLEALKQLSNRGVVEEALRWLSRLDPSGVVRTVDALKVSLDFEFICGLLKENRSALIEYVGKRIKDSEDPAVHQMYLEILVDEVKISDSQKERKKLRRAIFDASGIDWSEMKHTLSRDDRFPVEVLLIEAKAADPVQALEKLLRSDEDGLDAAELLCSRMNKEHPELFKKLLSYYLKKDPSDEQVRRRILSLLKGLGGGPEAYEVLEKVPSDWKLSDLSRFLLRSAARVEEDVLYAKLRCDLSKSVLQTLKSCEKLRGSSDFIVVDESTLCSFCGGPVGNETIVRHPQTNAIYHQACDSR
uniref:CNH domain-containing protein n=1 Tax=Steinernema glaseri TaxID=37863 RepID=A0A1I8AG98_9BILA